MATGPTGKLFDLTGKSAIVTGSGRGLGRAIARGLAAAGARVAPDFGRSHRGVTQERSLWLYAA